ncbi:MAG: hypothetical protein ACOY7T_16020 [Pseudomonadota bacterium]
MYDIVMPTYAAIPSSPIAHPVLIAGVNLPLELPNPASHTVLQRQAYDSRKHKAIIFDHFMQILDRHG